MLAKPVSTTQRWLGRSVLTCMLLGGGYAAWAAQPATPLPSAVQHDETKPVTLAAHMISMRELVGTLARERGMTVVGMELIPEKQLMSMGLKDVPLDTVLALLGEGSRLDARVVGGQIVISKSVKSANAASFEQVSRITQLQAAQVDASSRKANPPSYPKEAQQQNIGGMTVLIVDVAATGSVIAAKVKRTSGSAQLDAAALEAVQRWLFKPAMKNGKAIESQVTVPIEFDPGLKPENRVAAARAALARQAEVARPVAVAAMSSANTGWAGYDAMMLSLRGNWVTGQQPSTEGC